MTGNNQIDRRYYGQWYYAGHVQRLGEGNRFTDVKMRRALSLLEPRAGEKILDLGCGVGTVMIRFSAAGARMIGLDYATESLRIARSEFVKRSAGQPFAGVCADSTSLPLRTNTLDGVVAVDFTEHLDDRVLGRTVGEVFRSLRPGGRFAVYTPNPGHLFERMKARNILIKEDPSHIGLRPMPTYVKILEDAGFRVVRAYHEPTHIPFYSVLERTAMRLPIVGDLARRRICIRAEKPRD